MPRLCSICSHASRAEIDAALEGGASLDDVVAQFALPSRSALQRHRVGHLGRAVKFHNPPAAVTPLPAPAANGLSTDPPPGPEAALAALFERATGGPARSLQEIAQLTVDGLMHVYAVANTSGDLGVAVRALRELRALLQFHALVTPDKLSQHPGWRQPPEVRDPIFALERLLLAQVTGSAEEEAAARAELGDRAWPADPPIH